MNLRELEVFRAVMLAGTVTEAARYLRVSQPAVSMALANAEHRLGLKLFERRNRRLVPTPEADLLFGEVEPIFSRLNSVRTLAKSLKEADSGLVRIAGTPTLTYTLIADALQRYRAKSPGIKVFVEVSQTPQIVEMIETRQADLGVIYTSWSNQAVETVLLPQYQLTCVVRKDHPFAAEPYIEPQMLRGVPLIVNAHNPNFEKIQEAFRRMGVDLDYAVSSNHSTLTGLLVQTGGSVGIIDPWLRMDMLPDIVMVPFRPRIPLQPRVIYSRSRPLSRAASAFLDVLLQVVKPQEPVRWRR